jgi:hypothetical protein
MPLMPPPRKPTATDSLHTTKGMHVNAAMDHGYEYVQLSYESWNGPRDLSNVDFP